MVAYILDATRFREGALGAIWLTMGISNLSLFFSEAGVLGDRPIAMSLMISTCSGTTLFTTGDPSSAITLPLMEIWTV